MLKLMKFIISIIRLIMILIMNVNDDDDGIFVSYVYGA